MSNLTKTANGEVVESGGLVRVQYGAPEPETQSPLQAEHESAKVGNQAYRFGGGQVQSSGVSRYLVGSEPVKVGDVMSTAQKVGGRTTVELQPGVSGSRTFIETALREGLVRETHPGIYENAAPLAAPAAGQPGEAAPEVKEPATDEPFSYIAKEHLEEFQEMVNPVGQAAYNGTVAAAMASIARGDEGLDTAVQRLAKESGMDPAQAAELVETGEAMHRHHLTRDLASTGLISPDEADDFYEWTRGHRRLPEALSALLLEGKTRVFRALAQEFAVKKQGGRL